ncbi:MAG TPA: sulfatase-like hydrolase/transferase, partial [Chloroflexota bacterium]|nr:sulfatase-like hydrolase/transferase [Chloroflexota bacterium]
MNVLFIFSDQETAAITRPIAHTPYRTALERRGVTFANAYCTSPQCTPSRGSLLTGLFPHQTGVETNLDAIYARELSPETPTLGSRLQAAGFLTGYFGKWHLSAAGPSAYGFENVGTVHQHGHDDGAVAEEAAHWIMARGAEPWCAVVSFINPHDIYRLSRDPSYPIRDDADLPANLLDDLDHKPSPQRQFLTDDQGQPFVGAPRETWLRYRSAYADLLEQVDACLGQVLRALDESRQVERTVVVYTSDHGDLVGAHGLPYKGPCLYDELVHVPLVIAWPGLSPGRCTEPISQIDLLPTLLDATGLAPAPELPGRSLRPLL